MEDSSPQQLSVSELRERIIALSALQIELRGALQKHMDQESLTIQAIAISTGVAWSSLSRFLKMNRVIAGGVTLRNTSVYIGKEALGHDIEQLAQGVGDRYLGLACFNVDVIRLVFDLLEEYELQAETCSMIQFAAAFKPHDTIVYAALAQLRNPLVVLEENPELVTEIVDRLAYGDWQAELERIKQYDAAIKQEKIAEIERLAAIILPRFENKMALLAQYKLPAGGLSRSYLERAGDEQLGKFIEAFTKAIGPVKESVPDKEPISEAEMAEVQTFVEELLARYGAHAKIAKALGVPPSTWYDVRTGRSQSENAEELRNQARKLLEADVGSVAQPELPAPEPVEPKELVPPVVQKPTQVEATKEPVKAEELSKALDTLELDAMQAYAANFDTVVRNTTVFLEMLTRIESEQLSKFLREAGRQGKLRKLRDVIEMLAHVHAIPQLRELFNHQADFQIPNG